MTTADERIRTLLQQAREQLENARRRRSEPLAIIGMGCRFPGGASTPEALWRLLVDQVDATREVPPDRWDREALYDPDPSAPGKSYVRHGSFLDHIDGFDPQVFGISPREALALDPQQRLLLEVAWEALEDAGIPSESLRGSATGVWVGLCLDDYARRSITSGDLTRIDAYSALGNLRSVAAGRIAYVLGLQGPALQLDTACSSSLVALHLACQSLRSGECDLALVAGVNLICSPETTIGLCKLNALARDGRCKTFDAAADGYGRGEACGVLVLERLSDARARGRHIAALVRGTAVNHDGRSNGLTAPNGVAQEAVIRAALADGGVEAGRIGYVEAHGTGTPLGDPIEVLALSRALGATRDRQPVYVGSIKTNVGHTEGAAGVAGVMKVALSLSRRRILPQLHFHTPNPRIPWSELAIEVATQEREWTATEPRLAGVSSFGISGTNAHVVLEEPPPPDAARPAPQRSAELIVLSAQAPAALRARAADLLEHLQRNPELGLGDVAHSLLTTRTALPYRWVCAAPSRELLLETLRAATEGLNDDAPAALPNPRLVFVFPGQGSQWLGMGRQLLAEEPAFREALLECDRAVRAEAGWSIIEELTGAGAAAALERIERVQPLLFAVQIGLSALWQAWGVRPDAVIGHSMGEVAAACVAGALSLESAVQIICRRSALLRRIRGQGEMALVELSIEEATLAIRGLEERISVAVSNGKRSTVLSGDPRALAQVLAQLEARGVFCRRVKVDVASHSPQTEPLLDELRRSLAGVSGGPASIRIQSTVSGAVSRGPELDAAYWADNLRQPVLFEAGVRALVSDGYSLFVEISPHPLLVGSVEEIRAELAEPGLALGSLRREQPERTTLLESLGALFTRGVPLDARRVFPDGGSRVPLPLYPWQRTRYWLTPPLEPRAGSGLSSPTLLGVRASSPLADLVFESVLSVERAPWLADHRVDGELVVPGAALAELMRMAGAEHRGGPCELGALLLRAPVVLPDAGARYMQIVLTEGGTRVSLYTRAAPEGGASAWTLHATADVEAAAPPAQALDLPLLRSRCTRPEAVARVYERSEQVGLEYGPSFQGLRSLYAGEREALAEVELGGVPDAAAFALHPTLLDAALQAVFALSGPDAAPDAGLQRPLLPFEIARYAVYRSALTASSVHAELVEAAGVDAVLANVRLLDAAGNLVALVAGLHLRRSHEPLRARPGASGAARAELYHLEWSESAASTAEALGGRWLVASADAGEAAGIVKALGERGAAARSVGLSELAREPAEHVVCVWSADGGADAAMRATASALALVHALAERRRPPRLWWVTRNALGVQPGEQVALAGSPLWGLGRTLMQEKPELDCTLLDLDDASSVAGVLAVEAGAADAERQVAWRSGRRRVARLKRARDVAGARATSGRESTASVSPARRAAAGQGSVLITGGLGALGAESARSLAQSGAKHLILMGRQAEVAPSAAALVEELADAGAEVVLVSGDVSNQADVERALAAVPEGSRLRGVVHAAGVLDDGVLDEQTPERFARVMAPKVLGAHFLHAATRALDLEFFVLFSSLAGTLGSAGQSGYAAANTFLDALAAHRRALGLPGTSIAWGPWGERGLAAALDRGLRARLSSQGFEPLGMAEGRATLDAILQNLHRSEAHIAAAAIDLRKVSRAFAGAVPPLWRALIDSAPSAAPAASAGDRRPLGSLPPKQRLQSLLDLVRAEVARVLSLGSGAAVRVDQPLKELGLDSLMTVELRNALGRRLGLRLPGTLVFHHPTAHAIAKYLERALAEPHPSAAGGHTDAAHGECLRPLPAPRARLFGFHDAGGSANLFAPFCELDSEGVEIHAVSNARAVQPDSAAAARYLEQAVQYIRGFAEQPYVLFGHSLGGLFAWRVAKALAASRAPAPALLVLSATASPAETARTSSTAAMDAAFDAVVGERGVNAERFRGDFVADLALWNSMPPAPAEPLGVPIVTYVGREDEVATERALRPWAAQTTGEFALSAFPGGHFYILDEASRRIMLDDLRARLRRLQAAGAARARER